MSATRDPYAVLEIPVGADEATIRRAFRRLVREHHPDRSSAPGSEARFRELVEAYEQLVGPGPRPREPHADTSAITSFYAWLAGRAAEREAPEAPERDGKAGSAPPRLDRAVQLAAVAGLAYGIALLALLLTR